MAGICDQCPSDTLGGITLRCPDHVPALRGGPVSPSQEALGNCPKAVQCLWWRKGLSESGAHRVQQPHFCDPVRACLPLTARTLRVPLGESLLPRLPPAWTPVFCPVWLPCAIPSHPGVPSLTPGCPACSAARPTLMLGLSLQCPPEELSSGRGQVDRESLLRGPKRNT